MSSLYVLGGRQRESVLKHEREWNLYEAALILEIDTGSGTVRTCVEYKSPPEVRAGENSSVVFRAGTLVGNILYACTSTEVLVFKLPEFQMIRYVSLPCFNDLHHVTPTSAGALLVANTGLDMVVKVSSRGERMGQWSVLAEPPWSRFSPTTDYRKVASTKPHRSHPNFIFELNDEIWVTRARQRDAVCLHDAARHIDIALQFPHDGVVRSERIYFTLVDGRVVVANSRSLQVEQVFDVKKMDGEGALLGWCRGLLPLDDGNIWVGFSQIRKTWFEENILWVKNVFQDGMREKPTHIALYDLGKKRRLQEIDLAAHGMKVVFSILSAVPQAER